MWSCWELLTQFSQEVVIKLSAEAGVSSEAWGAEGRLLPRLLAGFSPSPQAPLLRLPRAPEAGFPHCGCSRTSCEREHKWKPQSFYNLVIRGDTLSFLPYLFIRSESLSPDHTQGPGCPRACISGGGALRAIAEAADPKVQRVVLPPPPPLSYNRT